MKFLFLLFSVAFGYRMETVTTICFFVNKQCHTTHAKDVAMSLQPGYLSHSTTSTKSGMHSIIIYAEPTVPHLP